MDFENSILGRQQANHAPNFPSKFIHLKWNSRKKEKDQLIYREKTAPGPTLSEACTVFDCGELTSAPNLQWPEETVITTEKPVSVFPRFS